VRFRFSFRRPESLSPQPAGPRGGLPGPTQRTPPNTSDSQPRARAAVTTSTPTANSPPHAGRLYHSGIARTPALMLINGLHIRIIHATTVEIIRLVDRLQRVGKDFKDVATIFFSASVWEEDGAAEVAELGLTKGSRVSVDGLWSKRTWTTKEGERRVTDVLTVSKVRLFTETEVARPEAVGDDAEPTPDEAIGQPAA
jgi:single-stranded DNA-binding protein